MKDLYIMHGNDYYTFDHGNDSASGEVELKMTKTAMGWNIEVTELTGWDTDRNTFLWVADTAREAFYDCMHALRYIERHNKYKVRAKALTY